MLTETEKEVVDPRLTQKVTCAFKGTALSDLCEKLKNDTGIPVTAGPSVADEKVTLFCEKLPLREVMRQLSRPFGYTWLRSGKAGEYRYELLQDLKSQLSLEELAGASMRVDYSQPGEFQWGNPDLEWHWSRWVIILEHGRQGRWAP